MVSLAADRSESRAQFGRILTREVALFQNDRQIKEVHYREHPADTARYSVRVWHLPLRGGE